MSEESKGGPNEASSALFTAALAAADRTGMADQLLSRQIELTELQIADLKREDSIRHWSLRVRHISDVMKLTFEIAGAIILLVIVLFLGSAIWAASNENGLVIDVFNVPAEMANRGMTGQVVAAQLQDKLGALQGATNSARPAESYANNWGDDIKVEIPDTGVSIGEFYRYFTGWLGDQTHINGEVVRTADGGLAITVRTRDAAATVTGRDGEFDALLQQAAEKIYEHTQPYRYAVFLPTTDQASIDRARAIFVRLAATGSLRDKLWSHTGLSTLDQASDPLRAPDEQRKSLALYPDFTIAYQNLSSYELTLGHEEAALHYAERGVELLRYNNGEMAERAWAISKPAAEGLLATFLCDFSAGIAHYRVAVQMPDYAAIQEASREQIVALLAALHDVSGARRERESWPAAQGPTRIQRLGGDFGAAFAREDWPAVLAMRGEVEETFHRLGTLPGFSPRAAETILSRQMRPLIAIAMARSGDVAAARALANTTPLDCFACLGARAIAAAAAKDWASADAWFKRATEYAPSIPRGWYEWGRALAAKGDNVGAMEKFDTAHDKAPHWADPLEAMGEVLLAQNTPDDAADKFEAAAEFAPRWGRLHLKWGQALAADGDRDGANREFARAASLDLTQAEQVELARLRAPALRQPR